MQVIDDPGSVEKYYKLLGNHFSSVRDYSTAEFLYIGGKMYKEAIEMYNLAGKNQ